MAAGKVQRILEADHVMLAGLHNARNKPTGMQVVCVCLHDVGPEQLLELLEGTQMCWVQCWPRCR